MKRWTLFALLVVTVVAGGLPMTVVAAAASNGAMHLEDTHCHDEGNGYVICYDTKGVTTETLTPSGKAIYTGNVRSTATVYFRGELISTTSTTRHYARIFFDELLQVLGERITTTEVIVGGKTCTYTYTVHAANGELQFENNEVVCQ